MICPRISHNIRLAQSGQVQICGHMVNSPGFNTVDELKNSDWIQSLKSQFSQEIWPTECIRCQEVESLDQLSIRQHSIAAHEHYVQLNKDYIFLTGLLDNVCNAACMMCSNSASTYIGKLINNVVLFDNTEQFNEIPTDRLLVFEITGGEPSVSTRYKRALMSLTSHTKYVRINTNGSRYMPEIEHLLKQNINVTITLSVDGIGSVFEYIRWPIQWDRFLNVVAKYQDLQKRYENLKLDIWTTVSALNINDFVNIQNFSNSRGIPMDYALVHKPDCLSIKYKNKFTIASQQWDLPMTDLVGTDVDNSQALTDFINKQDNIRKININDFIN